MSAENESEGSAEVKIDSVATTRKPTAQMKTGEEARARSASCRLTSDEAAIARTKGTMSAKVATRRTEIQGRPAKSTM